MNHSGNNDLKMNLKKQGGLVMKNVVKLEALFLALVLVFAFVSGCGTTGKPAPIKSPTITPTLTATPHPTITTSPYPTLTTSPYPTMGATGSPTASPGYDMKTTASIVNTNDAFEKAISKNGTWIICLLTNLTFSKDLVLDGEFSNGKKDEAGNKIIQRKIALYTQDENRNITNRFTLTAPKLTIKSPKASIQHGTFKGDVYVSANNFELVDATIEGNLYFTTDQAKSTFKKDGTSKITGKQELKK